MAGEGTEDFEDLFGGKTGVVKSILLIGKTGMGKSTLVNDTIKRNMQDHPVGPNQSANKKWKKRFKGCNESAVRLIDGENEFEGRVELCMRGEWGMVCSISSFSWCPRDAEVVCRQLGKLADNTVKRYMQDHPVGPNQSANKKWKKRFKGIQVQNGGHHMVLDLSLIVMTCHSLILYHNLQHLPYYCG